MKERAKKICGYLFCRERAVPVLVTCALLLFAWFAIFGEQGLYQLRRSYQLKKEMRRDIAALQTKVEQLKKERELLKEPAHLESVIRKELGYVRPGEVVFQRMDERHNNKEDTGNSWQYPKKIGVE